MRQATTTADAGPSGATASGEQHTVEQAKRERVTFAEVARNAVLAVAAIENQEQQEKDIETQRNEMYKELQEQRQKSSSSGTVKPKAKAAPASTGKRNSDSKDEQPKAQKTGNEVQPMDTGGPP